MRRATSSNLRPSVVFESIPTLALMSLSTFPSPWIIAESDLKPYLRIRASIPSTISPSARLLWNIACCFWKLQLQLRRRFSCCKRILFREVARLLVAGMVEDEGTRLRSGEAVGKLPEWRRSRLKNKSNKNGVFPPALLKRIAARSGGRVSTSHI